MRRASKRGGRWTAGFSLLELIISLTVLLIVMVSIFVLIISLQKSSSGTQARINTETQARAALDLMAEEAELAGSNPTVDTTITTSAGPCATACTIDVASGAGITTYDNVSIGDLADFEIANVQSTGTGSFSAALADAHAVGEPVVYPGYPYHDGICPNNSTTGTSGCSATKLQFYGNILGNNKLYFVEYNFDAAHNWLTRSITPMTAASKATAYVLCDNVQSLTFNVYIDSQNNYSSLSISITVQVPYPDPQTHAYPQISLQRGVIQARNVWMASQMQSVHDASNLPPTPNGINTFVP